MPFHCLVTQVKKIVQEWFSCCLLPTRHLALSCIISETKSFENLCVSTELFIVMSNIPEYMDKTRDKVSQCVTDDKKKCCGSQRASLDVMQIKMVFAGWGAGGGGRGGACCSKVSILYFMITLVIAQIIM